MDVADYLPGLRWPAQIELRAGRHVVRPRYEITQNDRVRIAHMNVERDNLQNDPNISTLPGELGRGYLLPFPILPRAISNRFSADPNVNSADDAADSPGRVRCPRKPASEAISRMPGPRP